MASKYKLGPDVNGEEEVCALEGDLVDDDYIQRAVQHAHRQLGREPGFAERFGVGVARGRGARASRSEDAVTPTNRPRTAVDLRLSSFVRR